MISGSKESLAQVGGLRIFALNEPGPGKSAYRHVGFAIRLNDASLTGLRTRQRVHATEKRYTRSRWGTVQGGSVAVDRSRRSAAELSSRTQTARASVSILNLHRNPRLQSAPGLSAKVR